MADDGFGPRVIRELHGRGLPEGVEAIDAGVGGFTLVGLFEENRRILLVDVARMGEAPGSLRVFPVRGGGDLPPATFSLHEIRLGDVMGLSAALGIRPEVVVFGVEPGCVRPGIGLSPAVESAVGQTVDAILHYIKDMEVQDGRQDTDRGR
jgi:hydrogenase maturation protease